MILNIKIKNFLSKVKFLFHNDYFLDQKELVCGQIKPSVGNKYSISHHSL